MGKKRDADKEKVAAFEAEMKRYALGYGIKEFVMGKRFKADIIATAREKGYL